MAWWSFFTGLFTGNKGGSTVGYIAKSAVEALDNWKFSEEERAKYAKDTMKICLDFQKATANESSYRSVARRKIAIGVVAVYLFIILFGCFVYKLDPEYAKFLFEVASSLNFFVTTIMIFYFGYYAVSNVISKAKKG